MTLRVQLDRLASTFAQSVFQAIRALSLEELIAETGPLRGMKVETPRAGAKSGRRSGTSRPERTALTRTHARGGRRGASGRLKRRSSDDIEKALGAVVELVEKRPRGLRAEQIRSELGMQAKEMPRVLGEGLATRRLRKRGRKRATTYYAA